jgi:predicted Zn-dependent protease
MANAEKLTAGARPATANRFLTEADVAIAAGRYEDAVAALERGMAINPQDAQLYERQALAFRGLNDLNRAAAALRTGRERVPQFYCRFTSNLAVIYYLGGAKQDALAELAAMRSRAPDEPNTVCWMGLIRLARLYVELDRGADARAVLAEHAALTAGLSDRSTQEQREQAQEMLDALP